MERIVFVFVLTLWVIYTGWPQATRSGAGEEEAARPPQDGSEAVHPAASRDSAQELQDIEDRLGPFSLAGRDFTVVLHYKRSPRGDGLDSRALVSLDIRDAAGAVQYQESFSYAIEGGAFSETCSADVRLLRGSTGTGLLIESGCLPSAPLAGWSAPPVTNSQPAARSAGNLVANAAGACTHRLGNENLAGKLFSI